MRHRCDHCLHPKGHCLFPNGDRLCGLCWHRAMVARDLTRRIRRAALAR